MSVFLPPPPSLSKTDEHRHMNPQPNMFQRSRATHRHDKIGLLGKAGQEALHFEQLHDDAVAETETCERAGTRGGKGNRGERFVRAVEMATVTRRWWPIIRGRGCG